MSEKPIVSVIMAVYNAGPFIQQAFASVLAQTMPEFEVIVVNDGSSNDTLERVKKIADLDNRIKYFSQPHSGVSVARNRGIRESSGRYLAFIDQDDLWEPRKLERQSEVFHNNPEIGLVYGRAAILEEDGSSSGLVGGITKLRRGRVFRELFLEHFIPLATVLIRKEVFDGLHQWFDESMEMAEEADLFLRIALRWKVDYCPQILAKWRRHSANDSKLRRALMAVDYKRIIQRLKDTVPGFARDFKKEIRKKEIWIAVLEIEILVSQRNRKAALGKCAIFVKDFGFFALPLAKLLIIFCFGQQFFEKVKFNLINLGNRVLMRAPAPNK